MVSNEIYVLYSSGKGQARTGKGWLLRQKALTLKPLPRAYTKVGLCNKDENVLEIIISV